MKKAKLLILSLLLANSSLWAIDAQSLKEEALGLWDKSKDVADTVGEKVRDTWDDSEPLREAIGEKSAELWDDSEPLRENLEEKTKDGWQTAKEWSTKKYDELNRSEENPDNSSAWWNFSDSEKKSEDDSAVENSLKELWEKTKDGSKQLGEKIQENTKSLL
ncbi:MAG TPA: hypothetical protein DDZ97_11590 [Deltaproteobacteria bacterium]|nr:hypothetical protein [Deltaproteobacteria bacterium]|tara:strand:- start:8397 stop:8882 length:486 start_codon:yes stop_codon:yes gene_type:complete